VITAVGWPSLTSGLTADRQCLDSAQPGCTTQHLIMSGLGVLILTPGVGVPAGPGRADLPGFSTSVPVGPVGGWSVRPVGVAWNSWDQACSHGQCRGRCASAPGRPASRSPLWSPRPQNS